MKVIRAEVIDGDEYRKSICADLGFSKQDRVANIRRLAFVASRFSGHGILPIICAINPYEEIRKEVAGQYVQVKTVWINCSLEELTRRDTKGLYRRARLPINHPEKIANLTGVNDPFEEPVLPDLILQTDRESPEQSIGKLIEFIGLQGSLFKKQ